MARRDPQKPLSASVQFSRRSVFLFGCQAAIAGGLTARMYQLQILEGENYREQAERSRIKPTLLAPTRGRILARDGQPLATNKPNYQIVLYREKTEDLEKTLEQVARLARLSDEQVAALLKESKQSLEFLPVLISENLDWETFARVNANAPALPGIEPRIGLTRHYPEGEKMAHLVGYVSAATQDDIDREREVAQLLRLPDIRVGRSGVERIEEAHLRGAAGVVREERDVRGRPMRELERTEGVEGKDLTLTLDAKLQDYALRRLGDEAGSVVVMDIYDGDVLALASSPSFDPNGFVLGLSNDEWSALRSNERRPLSHKAVAGLYPPGSTFKMLVALAALKHGLIGPDHKVSCIGHTKLGNRKFHCWKRGGHGAMNLHEAIKQSCDIYFYDLAMRLGIDKLADTAEKFGIGTLPEIGLPDARKGLMPTKAWKWSARGEAWQGGETMNSGLGRAIFRPRRSSSPR